MAISSFVRRTAAVGAVAIALSAAAAGQAHASAHRTPPVTHFLEKQGMYVGGFDAAVAKAHGYKIVTYANGDQQAVPVNSKSGLPKGPLLVKASARKGGVSPDNSSGDTVYGDCGYSWIAGEQTGTHQIELSSGFGVDDAAVEYSWTVQLSDENGTSTHHASGTLALDSSWSDEWTGLNQYDYSIDEALTSSYAIMDDGSVCYSGGPYMVLTGLG